MYTARAAASWLFPGLMALCIAAASSAQNCANGSIGQLPLNDLATSSYQGFQGGLYPGGSNQMPVVHQQEGLLRAGRIQSLDALGQPSANGRIVLLSIGMSNTTQEFSTWQRFSDVDGERNPRLTIVDGAQGGQDAAVFANGAANAWTVVDQRLAAAGVTGAQVQAVWIKQASANPATGFPAHMHQLQAYLVQIVQHLQARFANLQVCYLSSRTYGGYAWNPQRGEPLSFETGFAVQQLVAAQIAGDPALNFDPARGPVRAPWLAWGPYLWADGQVPRSDGGTWRCGDYVDDGVHPSQFGRYKVARLLDTFFRSDRTTTPWYLGGSGQAIPAVLVIGSGCTSPAGSVALQASGVPRIGNAGFFLRAQRLTPGQPAVLLLAASLEPVELVRGCDLYVDLATLWPQLPPLLVAGNGTVSQPLPIPTMATLSGLRFHGQFASLDPAGAPFPGTNLTMLFSPACELRVGP